MRKGGVIFDRRMWCGGHVGYQSIQKVIQVSFSEPTQPKKSEKNQ